MFQAHVPIVQGDLTFIDSPLAPIFVYIYIYNSKKFRSQTSDKIDR